MHTRSRPTRDEAARATLALPCCRDEDVGVARIHLHVVGAGPVVYVEYSRPRCSAIGRLVDATLAPLAPDRTLRRDVDNVGVSRVDQDAADMFAFLEADVFPRAAAVDRLVDTVTVRDDALRVVFAGADPDHVRIFRVDRDGAYRKRALSVEDRRE